jgi:hypothetical protein
MRVTEKYVNLTVPSGVQNALFSIPAPYEGCISKLVVRQKDGSFGGYTALLMSNPDGIPINDTSDTYSLSFNENLLTIASITVASGQSLGRLDKEFGLPYRNLREYYVQTPDRTHDQKIYLKLKLPAAPPSNINFEVAITIFTFSHG